MSLILIEILMTSKLWFVHNDRMCSVDTYSNVRECGAGGPVKEAGLQLHHLTGRHPRPHHHEGEQQERGHQGAQHLPRPVQLTCTVPVRPAAQSNSESLPCLVGNQPEENQKVTDQTLNLDDVSIIGRTVYCIGFKQVL